MKRCGRCHAEKPNDAFYSDRSKNSGVSSYCRDCTKANVAAKYADPEQRAIILARNRTSAHRYVERTRQRRHALRLEMIAAYGGQCECCGEANHEFLTVDHIDGDGAAERREIGTSSAKIHVHLKKLGWPKDRYRLLCFNCNCSMGIRRYCPHQANVRVAS